MAITKSQKRLVFILLIAVGYAAYDLLSNSEQYKALLGFGSSQEETKKVREKGKKDTKTKTIVEDTVKNIVMNWGRDPFFTEEMRPPKKKIIRRKPEVKLNLNAITFSGENSIVIINDQILKEGEMIEGYKVEKIYLNKVKLNKLGRIRYLTSE